MLTRANAAAEVMEHLVTHEAHGYSQPNRLGDGTTETLTLSDGEQVTFHGGDYDCSEAVRACYAAVGVLPKDSYMWTGNEVELLTLYGFGRVSLSDRKRGDVLLRSGHTEILLDRNTQAGFRRSETGGIDGKQGDQDGYESASSAYDGKWESCWRYFGAELEDDTTEESEDTMTCIIRIQGESGHYYFDGIKAHPIHSPEELKTMDKAYALATGKKELPRAVWPKAEVQNLLNVTRR